MANIERDDQAKGLSFERTELADRRVQGVLIGVLFLNVRYWDAVPSANARLSVARPRPRRLWQVSTCLSIGVPPSELARMHRWGFHRCNA
jgi:hypothetical protein